MEESLSQVPENLKKRKEILDIASKTSDERSALKLPPVYDDVDFSDDERLVRILLLSLYHPITHATNRKNLPSVPRSPTYPLQENMKISR